jgi:hypothetical protein
MIILIVNAASYSQAEVDALQGWICRSFPSLRKLIRADLNKKIFCPAVPVCPVKSKIRASA